MVLAIAFHIYHVCCMVYLCLVVILHILPGSDLGTLQELFVLVKDLRSSFVDYDIWCAYAQAASARCTRYIADAEISRCLIARVGKSINLPGLEFEMEWTIITV
jgi:hypothetical protein